MICSIYKFHVEGWDGIISTAEAQQAEINLTGRHLADIKTLMQLVTLQGVAAAYNGLIRCCDGLYQFNFNFNKYEKQESR